MVRRSRAVWWGVFASIVVGTLAFVAGVSLALNWGADLPFAGLVGPTGGARRATPASVRNEFDVYWQAWDLVEQSFYRDKPLDYRKMMYGSLSGMLHSLGDDYTFFQEPEDASRTREQLDGQFEGIGAYINVKDGQLVIVAPIEESPAEKAGLQAGDIIVKVNDADVGPQLANLPTDSANTTATKLIRGPRGSAVKLVVQRPATGQTLQFTIVRDAIPLITVNSKMLDGGIAYVQITQFEGTTTKQLDRALVQLMAQHPRGIILDLRNNPGGLLDTALDVLGRFVKDGTGLYERFGNGEEKTFPIHTPTGGPTAYDTPLTVLINGNSASASEIVAGALHDLGRATLLGEKSFGKGSVQTVVKLADGSSARITIARWLTPNKTQIHKLGIQPDVYVPLDNKPQFMVALPKVKPSDPDQVADSQLFWAVKRLSSGEQPPDLPRPTPVPDPNATVAPATH